MIIEIKSHDEALAHVPDHLRPIVEVLLKNEDNLSDGYGYYCEYLASEEAGEFYQGNLVIATLAKIANEIYQAVTNA